MCSKLKEAQSHRKLPSERQDSSCPFFQRGHWDALPDKFYETIGQHQCSHLVSNWENLSVSIPGPQPQSRIVDPVATGDELLTVCSMNSWDS